MDPREDLDDLASPGLTAGPDPTTLPFDFAQAQALLARTVDIAPGRPGPDLAAVMAELAALRLPPGSPVLVSLANGTALLRLLFAALLTGACPVLVAPSTAPARWEELAAHLRPALIVGGSGRTGGVPGTALRLAGSPALRPDAAPRRHAPGQLIVLTSGTSGSATGCLHDVGSLLRNARLHAGALGVTAADTLLVTLPVHYSFALVAQVFAALVTGASLVLSRPPFTVPGYLRELSQAQVTVSSLTPRLVVDLLAAGGRLPRRLRVFSVGGQATPPAHTAALLAANPQLELYLTYGLTEAGPRVATLAAHQEPSARHHSVGRPLPGVRLSLRPAATGAQELLVASPTLYRERVGAPPAPGPQRGGLVGPGLLATGDLASLEDGYLVIQGRTTDFAVIRGEKVSLASVRRAAESISGVVRATTRVDPDAEGYRLNVFLERPLADGKSLERRLCALLSRHERPAEVTLRLAPADMLLK